MKLLLTLLNAYKAQVLELAGAALIVVGLFLVWGTPVALIALGVVLLLKAFELDLTADDGDRT